MQILLCQFVLNSLGTKSTCLFSFLLPWPGTPNFCTRSSTRDLILVSHSYSGGRPRVLFVRRFELGILFETVSVTGADETCEYGGKTCGRLFAAWIE